MELSTRRLNSADASALVALRREALEAEPLAFEASLADGATLTIDSVSAILDDRDRQAIFGAFDRSDLVGMLGLFTPNKTKIRHKAMIWGMYVKPSERNKGAGRELLIAAIEQARSWGVDQVQLSVTEAAPAARHLYESLGFSVWGHERRALCWNEHFVDEYHLALHFDA
jgi:GNAT superfamily N-acetyltransferase